MTNIPKYISIDQLDCHESKDLTEELLIAKIKVWPDEKLRKKINAIAKKIDKETAKNWDHDKC